MRSFPPPSLLFALLRLGFFGLLLFGSAFPVMAQGDLQAKVKAAYIFNCMRFVEWPGESKATSPLRIGVIGTDPVARLLDELQGRKIGDRTLVVEHYDSALPKPVNCHLFFIGQTEANNLPSLLQQMAPMGVLTVSDIAQFTHQGGAIGFIHEEGRIKLMVNLRTAKQNGLKISAKLLEVAKVIR